jgi:hypothetical protein
VGANPVWSIFDFALVVANPGVTPAKIEVKRGAQVIGAATINPGVQERVFLPWVPELKGPDSDVCGGVTPMSGTVRAADGAYRLTSDRPIAVYQFSALQARGEGGLPGKSWASCPGNQACFSTFTPLGCFAFSNDASLLLPTTALGKVYRAVAPRGLTADNFAGLGAYLSVTGTKAGTTVKITLPPGGALQAGGGIGAVAGGQSVSFPLGVGEVMQLQGVPTSDLSGALIEANNPVQVLSGVGCSNVPDNGTAACDHQEELLPPATALGKRHLVAPPTGPKGNVPGHQVWLVGHVDGTTLGYKGKPPPGAPVSINAGQAVNLGIVKDAFEVLADKPMLVGVFLPGATLLDPSAQENALGDPALSIVVPVEQFRSRYAFLTPDDFDVTRVEVVAPEGASLSLDGAPVTAPGEVIEGTGFRVVRLAIDASKVSAHLLEASAPVGVQVTGYAPYTSYQYPAGANFKTLP